MTYSDVIILDQFEHNPVSVQLVGSVISISDNSDDVLLTEAEAKRLFEVLKDHFNL